MVICAYGTYLLCNITPDVTGEPVTFWTCVRGIGVGSAMMTAGLDAVAPKQGNQASAPNNVSRQVFGALGLAGCRRWPRFWRPSCSPTGPC